MTRSPQSGSSPLTRGKPCGGVRSDNGWGLIPAHAGKTGTRWYQKLVPGAHPRSRGENLGRTIRPNPGEGSSPLTRGKQSFGHRRSPDPGLIPAHAGKTIPRLSPISRVAAHPRSRGENPSSTMASGLGSGSSPLTRGKPSRVCIVMSLFRLIPAHAGKTGLWAA